ncbi:hypothetical protein HDV00_008047 [Rhizophlyctis rosea]|nr:hypothetical protein HDV00_008047 [Rhizophlyctis rosea]
MPATPYFSAAVIVGGTPLQEYNRTDQEDEKGCAECYIEAEEGKRYEVEVATVANEEIVSACSISDGEICDVEAAGTIVIHFWPATIVKVDQNGYNAKPVAKQKQIAEGKKSAMISHTTIDRTTPHLQSDSSMGSDDEVPLQRGLKRKMKVEQPNVDTNVQRESIFIDLTLEDDDYDGGIASAEGAGSDGDIETIQRKAVPMDVDEWVVVDEDS